MKKINFPVLSLLIMLFFISCSKSDSNDNSRQGTDDMPAKLMETFDEFDVIQLNDDEVVAANGLTITQIQDYLTSKYGAGRQTSVISMTPNDQLIKLKEELIKNQKDFTDDEIYSEIPDQPNGLAYVYGGKDDGYHDPHAESVCRDRLRGLDCSGMVYQGALNSGVTSIPKNSDVSMQATVSNWNTWLKNSIYKDLTASLKPMSFWNDNDWDEGDLIIFNKGTDAQHIGTLVRKQNNGKLAIIHSQGKKSLSCDLNKGPKRGPKLMSSDNDPGNWNFFTKAGTDIKTIHRLRFEITDAYNLKLRCVGASSFAYTINLKVDTSVSGTYQDEITFLDYDGSTINQTFEYTYNKDTKIFSFHSVMTDSEFADPNSKRIDDFTITSNQINVPVVSATSFTGDFQGCPAEFVLNSGYSSSSEATRLAHQNQNTHPKTCSLMMRK